MLYCICVSNDLFSDDVKIFREVFLVEESGFKVPAPLQARSEDLDIQVTGNKFLESVYVKYQKNYELLFSIK